MNPERIIKKYPNRRLYDAAVGSYITLEDIKKLVIEHVAFKVVDAKTNKDLTQATLLQIIADQESNSTPMFTTPFLQDFIRLYHEKSQNIVSQYLEDMMKTYTQQKDFFEKQWQTYQSFFINPMTTKNQDPKSQEHQDTDQPKNDAENK